MPQVGQDKSRRAIYSCTQSSLLSPSNANRVLQPHLNIEEWMPVPCFSIGSNLWQPGAHPATAWRFRGTSTGRDYQRSQDACRAHSWPTGQEVLLGSKKEGGKKRCDTRVSSGNPSFLPEGKWTPPGDQQPSLLLFPAEDVQVVPEMPFWDRGGQMDTRTMPRSPPTSAGLWGLHGIKHSVVSVKLIACPALLPTRCAPSIHHLLGHTSLSSGRNLVLPGAVSAVPLRLPLSYPQPILVLSVLTARHMWDLIPAHPAQLCGFGANLLTVLGLRLLSYRICMMKPPLAGPSRGGGNGSHWWSRGSHCDSVAILMYVCILMWPGG